MPQAALAAEEQRFLERLHSVMMASNFSLLDCGSFEDSFDAKFRINLSLAGHPEKLDGGFVREFTSRHAEEAEFRDAAAVLVAASPRPPPAPPA